MRTIDLNADVGESFGAWTMGRDAELIPLLTSVNIACGFHAGDPATIAATVALAKANGVAIGLGKALPSRIDHHDGAGGVEDGNVFGQTINDGLQTLRIVESRDIHKRGHRAAHGGRRNQIRQDAQ